MSHSYISNRLHIVFSTKGRRDVIAPEAAPKLWAYIAGIGRNIGAQISHVGGTGNHVHLLLGLPATVNLAAAVQKIKGSSSKWMSDSGAKNFKWQEGYAAFSVSASNLKTVGHYIETQEEHHAKHSFEDEFRSLLIKHGIKFDGRFVFG